MTSVYKLEVRRELRLREFTRCMKPTTSIVESERTILKDYVPKKNEEKSSHFCLFLSF